MKLILRYLKPYRVQVLLSLLFLFGQAAADFTLPNLMSDIVNVGIQRSGVADGAPAALSAQGLALVQAFMSPADRQLVQSGYALVNPGSAEAARHVADYTLLERQPVYIRSAADAAPLEAAYSRASLAFMTLAQSRMAQAGAVALDPESGFSGVEIGAIYAMLPALEQMPAEALAPAIQAAAEADSLLGKQIGVTFTKLFYAELGVDLAALQRRYILRTGLVMLLVALGGVIAAVAVGYLASRTAAAVARRMRRDVFQKVESFSSAEFDRFSTASLITRTTNDVQQVQMLVVMGLRMMLFAPIMGIGGTIFALSKSLSLSWTIAVAVIVLLGFVSIIFSISLPKFKILQDLIDRLNLVSRENLTGIMVIRAFGNEEYEEGRFEAANRNLAETTRFVQRTMSLMMPAMTLVMSGASLLIMWVGAHAIAASTLQIGDMMAFMQYTMHIIMSFLMMAMMFIMLPRALVSATRIGEVLDTELAIRDPERPKPLGEPKGLVEFKNVSFRYHNAEEDVLHDISFVARPGETTAVIGSTGSGKSTVVNLLPRFYDITAGSITIGGVDIREVAQHELRESIGYVPQKGSLFSGDIDSNIRYGKPDATTAEVEKALEVAQARAFVAAMEGDLKAPIAQGGTNVSGGQKQRLSIARALAKNPPIYIFDDTFSALDFKTDAALRRALWQYTANATVLVVTQRVSTIMAAEQIIVLDQGRVVGIGRHRELLNSCPTYREIAESQLSQEELA